MGVILIAGTLAQDRPRPTLEETIALLEATLESTHDGILVVDLDRRIIRYNRQYLKMFGFTPDDLERGGLDGIYAALIPQLEDADAQIAQISELRKNPEQEILDVVRFKDGRVFERYIAPHRLGSRIVGRVASFRDIGQSVRAAEALEQHRTFL
jgi:PAS domain S-box-containing protein